MTDAEQLRRLLINKVRKAVDDIEALMLTDAWEALPESNQLALARVVQDMRADAERLEEAFRLG